MLLSLRQDDCKPDVLMHGKPNVKGKEQRKKKRGKTRKRRSEENGKMKAEER